MKKHFVYFLQSSKEHHSICGAVSQPSQPRWSPEARCVPPPSSAAMGGCHPAAALQPPAAPARFWDSTHLVLLIKGAERGWKYLNKEQKEQHGSLNAA